MTYTVSCMGSLLRDCLTDLLATPAKIVSLSRDNGWATIVVEFDAATAAAIAKRWHVSEI